jgi:hypothetical protein
MKYQTTWRHNSVTAVRTSDPTSTLVVCETEYVEGETDTTFVLWVHFMPRMDLNSRYGRVQCLTHFSYEPCSAIWLYPPLVFKSIGCRNAHTRFVSVCFSSIIPPAHIRKYCGRGHSRGSSVGIVMVYGLDGSSSIPGSVHKLFSTPQSPDRF